MVHADDWLVLQIALLQGSRLGSFVQSWIGCGAEFAEKMRREGPGPALLWASRQYDTWTARMRRQGTGKPGDDGQGQDPADLRRRAAMDFVRGGGEYRPTHLSCFCSIGSPSS